MKIAIVGAGFAGLGTAKVLQQDGHQVTVFEKAPDIGGVWSRTRSYPGLRTQNNKGTYALTDLKMPRSCGQWPTGAEVRAYLEAYSEKFRLISSVRLATEVTSAEPTSDGWDLTTRSTATGALHREEFDHLVVANGVFSEPVIPSFDGAHEFVAAGGRLCAAGEFADAENARGKHVVVIGYGKSACDISVPISEVAASTNVVARELLWKMPRKLGGVLNYKYLMLTRMGEALFRYLHPVGFEKFLHGPGDTVRRRLLGSVQAVSTRQLRLEELGLVPHGAFTDIARSTVSLATEGFYERVGSGSIQVHRDQVVSRLLEKDGRPHAELVDGTLLAADIVVCGTGFRQVVPFFSAELMERITDDEGNFELYRQIHPVGVPRLSFAGYNSSLFSPLSAEMAAVWIASKLAGVLSLPSEDEMRGRIGERLRWMEERTEGRHARGTNIIPFSMHNIDETLTEIALNVGPLTRARQWLLPINPRSYRSISTRMVARNDRARAGAAARIRPAAAVSS